LPGLWGPDELIKKRRLQAPILQPLAGLSRLGDARSITQWGPCHRQRPGDSGAPATGRDLGAAAPRGSPGGVGQQMHAHACLPRLFIACHVGKAWESEAGFRTTLRIGRRASMLADACLRLFGRCSGGAGSDGGGADPAGSRRAGQPQAAPLHTAHSFDCDPSPCRMAQSVIHTGARRVIDPVASAVNVGFTALVHCSNRQGRAAGPSHP